MVKKVKQYMEEMNFVTPGDTIVLGVSGGADSVCLLCVLHEIFLEEDVHLQVVHVNHNIREDAMRDQRYVEHLCEELSVPFVAFSYPVEEYAKEHHISTEEAGRILRYEALETLRRKVEENGGKGKIAVAHTMEDNAETMLFHLFRGSGLKGLTGIPAQRGNIIRPLLCVRRKEIEAYLNQKHIAWCHDCTNDGDDYTRNVIRHKILPVAEERINEKSVECMNRTARQLSSLEDYIQEEIKRAMGRCAFWETKEAKVLINETELFALHPYLRKRVLLELMEKTASSAKDLSEIHVTGLEQLFTMQSGKQIHLPYGMMAEKTYEGVLLWKQRNPSGSTLPSKGDSAGNDSLHDTKHIIEEMLLPLTSNRVMEKDLPYLWEGELPDGRRMKCKIFEADSEKRKNFPKEQYTKWFDYDKIGNVLKIRTRREGDYFAVNSLGNTQKLKSYFVNEKISAKLRDEILLVADGAHILWIIGYRESQAYHVTESTKRILEMKVCNGIHETDSGDESM